MSTWYKKNIILEPWLMHYYLLSNILENTSLCYFYHAYIYMTVSYFLVKADPTGKPSGSSSDAGVIAGSVIGVIVLIAVIVVVVVLYLRWKSR